MFVPVRWCRNSTRNFRMFTVLWAVVSSWWSSHNLSYHKSRLFSHTEHIIHHMISSSEARTHCGQCPLISKNAINMTDCWLWLSYLFWLWRRRRCLLTALGLGPRVVLITPCLITSDDTTKQFWFTLKTFVDVLTHLHVVLLLIII